MLAYKDCSVFSLILVLFSMYTVQKKERKKKEKSGLKIHQISMGGKIMLDIYNDMDWVMCGRQDPRLFDKISNL